MIKSAISAGHYTSIFHCLSDLSIMCINAKAYNEPRTAVYDQSLEIILSVNEYMRGVSKTDKLITTPVNPQYELADYTVTAEHGTPCVPSDNCMIWQQFNKVLSKCNKNGRPIAPSFLLLPERSEFAVYYKEISNPMSLCGIRSKLICGKYHTLNEIITDLILTCDNAIQFNKKSSVIHKDAANLKDYINSLSVEHTVTEQCKKTPGKVVGGEKKRASQIISSPESKPKIIEKKQKLSQKLPASSPETKTKIGQKRRVSQISASVAAASSPEVKSEKNSEIPTTQSTSNDFVKKCFEDLKNSGPGLQNELTQCCSTFHKKVIDVSEIGECLAESDNPRNILLNIVCALMSRLDPLCMEYSTTEHALVGLVQVCVN